MSTIPEHVARLTALMSTFDAPWALCGGWAVDAWLGRKTREHGDVDIVVFIQDQQALYEHLRGWQLVAHAPNERVDRNEVWDGHRLDLPMHIHGRVDRGEAIPERGALWPEDGFVLDLQFGDRAGGDWILPSEPQITRPLSEVIQQSSWGVPAVVAELLFFFKATEPRRRDTFDFHALGPKLSREQRDWLRDALPRVRHPWLAQLTG